MITKFINWFLGLFYKSETPKFDKEIKDKKAKIKKLDKELDEEYTSVDEAMKEFK